MKKTNKLLIVHEDTRTGGIAGEIAAIVCEGAFEDLDGPIARVTALDTPVPYSPPLEETFCRTLKRLSRPRANWQNTKGVDERGRTRGKNERG